MVFRQRSSGHIFLLALCVAVPVQGFRDRHAHGSFRRPDHHGDGNITQPVQKTPNSMYLHILLAKETSEPSGRGERVMDSILRMQVETCVHMRKLWSTKFEAYEDCLDMLLKLCNPGKDMVMDGDPGETPTGEGFCKTYFGYARIMRKEVKKHTEECVALAEQESKSPKDIEKLEACDTFMTELCESKNDKLMDSKSKKQLTGQGYCQQYFHSRNKGSGDAGGTAGADGKGRGAAGGTAGADGNGSGGAAGGTDGANRKGSGGAAGGTTGTDGNGSGGDGSTGGTNGAGGAKSAAGSDGPSGVRGAGGNEGVTGESNIERLSGGGSQGPHVEGGTNRARNSGASGGAGAGAGAGSAESQGKSDDGSASGSQRDGEQALGSSGTDHRGTEGSVEGDGQAGGGLFAGKGMLFGAAFLGLCLIGLCCLGFLFFFTKSPQAEDPAS